MDQTITIREALTEQDVELFYAQLAAYHIRDIFPDPSAQEDRAYFLGSQYRDALEEGRRRNRNRLYALFFQRQGVDIGFAMPVIYDEEDGKCFIMEFCVCPQFRGNRTGICCGQALLKWAFARGADYAELNCGGDERRPRFWKRLGFLENGYDEWGEPLMLLPPREREDLSVRQLSSPADWQLTKLMNGYKAAIGEPPMSEEENTALHAAAAQGRIRFFLAYRGYRAVGMCSVSTHYSTFCCGEVGVLEDLFVEPVFRGMGAAKLLTLAALEWSREQGLGSLSVTCAPVDEEMYRKLGFNELLGRQLCCVI